MRYFKPNIGGAIGLQRRGEAEAAVLDLGGVGELVPGQDGPHLHRLPGKATDKFAVQDGAGGNAARTSISG